MGLFRRFARRRPWISAAGTLVFRLITLTILVGALELGITKQVFAFSSITVSSLTIDPDILLIFLGIINKVADYLVEFVLDDIAGKCLVHWMVNADPNTNPSAGVYVNDFEMVEELTKPWLAIGGFASRWKHKRWLRGHNKTLWDWVRMVLSLAVSISFLLLGAGINTVGIPKARWYPDQYVLPVTPRMTITNINHEKYLDKARRQIGTVAETTDMSNSLIAQDMFKGLNGLFDTFAPDQSPRGFAPAYEYLVDDLYRGLYNASSITAINSTISLIGESAAVNSTSTWGPSLDRAYQELTDKGPKFGRENAGILGFHNLTRPMLTTVCSEGLLIDPNSLATLLRAPTNISQSDNVIGIQLPAASDLYSPGFTCNVTLRQIIYATGLIRQDKRALSWYIDHGFDPGYHNVTLLPASPADLTIASSFNKSLHDVVPWLDNMSSGHSFGRHVLLAARQLQDRNQRQSLNSDLLATTAVVSTILQNMLTISDWAMEVDETITETHSVRYFVYGSGPRLGWEWIAAVVLGILAVVVVVNILWILMDPSPPSHLLEPAGMMLVANSSRPMESAETSEKGELDTKHNTARFYIVETSDRPEEITDDKRIKKEGMPTQLRRRKYSALPKATAPPPDDTA